MEVRFVQPVLLEMTLGFVILLFQHLTFILYLKYVISQVKTEIVAKAIYHLSEQLGGIVEDVQQVIYPCFVYNSLMVIFYIFSF